MGIESLIKGSELVTSVFGYWPSFHDAEVVWLRLCRDDEIAEDSPSLEMLIHTFEMTAKVAASGQYVLRNHVLVHFRFIRVVESKFEEFNYQNVLFEFAIKDIRNEHLESIDLAITLQSSFGLSGEFRCKAAEVLAVTPCDENGREIRS